MEGARGDEAEIERRRRRRHHAERVLHGHEEQQPGGEYARQPMVPRHVEDVVGRPRHEEGLGGADVDYVAVLRHSHFVGGGGGGVVVVVIGVGRWAAPVVEGEGEVGGG